MTLASASVGASFWNFDPAITSVLFVAAVVYGAGVKRLWRDGARGRGVAVSRVVAFYGALLVMGIALLSPLDALAARLFSVHMVQHLVLMFVVAPLLIHAAPLLPVVMALPRRARRIVRTIERSASVAALRRIVTNPLVVLAVYAVALWAWHLPALYEAALSSDALHALEHWSFLVGSLLFWWLVSPGPRRIVSFPVALLLVFGTALHSAALGALLTFASDPLYPTHVVRGAVAALTPLADQQLAGTIMWVPSGAVYLITMAMLFAGWLGETERKMQRAEMRGLARAGEDR